MGRIAVPGVFGLLVVMALVLDVRVCSPFPKSCLNYASGNCAVPEKFCCLDIQNKFLLNNQAKVNPKGIKCLCHAVENTKYNIDAILALGIPKKCALNSYYKEGQACPCGAIVPGGYCS